MRNIPKNKNRTANSGFARFGLLAEFKVQCVLANISNKSKNWEWLSPNLAKPQNVVCHCIDVSVNTRRQGLEKQKI